jgi:broad specificity phosphatase PhoE
MDRVLVGEQQRHAQTVEHCWKAFRKESPQPDLNVVGGFSEFDHVEVLHRFRPDLAGQAALNEWLSRTENPRREFQNVFAQAFARWVEGKHDGYRESFVSFRTRCWQALLDLLDNAAPSDVIWIFTSAGPISAIVQQALAISDERIPQLTWVLVNTGITKLLCRDGGVRVATINQYAHLEEANRSEWITYR